MLIAIGIFGFCVLVFVGALMIGFDVVKDAKPLKHFSTPKSDRLIYVWLVFLLIYFAFSLLVGGTAQHGYVEAGKYFVSSRGEATQVSWAVWHPSLIFAYLFIFGFVCIFAIRLHEWRVNRRDSAD